MLLSETCFGFACFVSFFSLIFEAAIFQQLFFFNVIESYIFSQLADMSFIFKNFISIVNIRDYMPENR